MRTVAVGYLFFAAVAGMTSIGAGEQLDVYLLTGQSNSLGTTQFEGTTPDQFGPGSHAADILTDFFWSNVSASNSIYPPVLYGDSGDLVTQLQMQQGGPNNPAFWGPEFGFARTLHEPGTDRRVLIIKASRGGGGNALWDQATFDTNQNAGHMWGHVRDTVTTALSAVADRGDSFLVKGLLYLQGESNNGSEATLADARLTDFVGNLKAHINAQFPQTADQLRTVIGEIAASGSNANRQLTTERQRELAASNPAMAFVDSRDLALKTDGIHFGKQSKLEIGRRFARAMQGDQIRMTSFDEIVDGASTTNLVFEEYVPDSDGTPDGPIWVQAGTFRGFAEGSGGQLPVGVVVDGAANQVVFADYVPQQSMSVIAAGAFDFAGQGLPATWDDSGEAVTFTFLNPENLGQKATVSEVAFRLWGAAQDNVQATFLDVRGHVLFESGFLEADEGFGFEAIESFTGEPHSVIHQVIISGDPGTLWGVGDLDPAPPRSDGGREAMIPDFSFGGFTVVPEPTGCVYFLIGCSVIALRQTASATRRRCAGNHSNSCHDSNSCQDINSYHDTTGK